MSDFKKNSYGSIFAIITLLLFGVLAFYYIEKQNNPNTNIQFINDQVKIKKSPDGHFRVPGFINGISTVFFIDTGATIVALNDAIARQANLVRMGESKFNTANGLVTNALTKIDTLSFAGITINNVSASIGENTGDHVLIGMNVLKKFDIIIKDDVMILKIKKE